MTHLNWLPLEWSSRVPRSGGSLGQGYSTAAPHGHAGFRCTLCGVSSKAILVRSRHPAICFAPTRACKRSQHPPQASTVCVRLWPPNERLIPRDTSVAPYGRRYRISNPLLRKVFGCICATTSYSRPSSCCSLAPYCSARPGCVR